MSNVKPWQLGVIVVGLVVGVGSVVWTWVNRSDVRLNHNITLVDVQDGQLYEFDNRRVHAIIPARHPETGVIALVRVAQDSGKWYVIERDRILLGALGDGVKNTAVDEQTWEVRTKGGRPVAYSLPKAILR